MTANKEVPQKTLKQKLKEHLKEYAEFKTVYKGNYQKFFGTPEKAELFLVSRLLQNKFTLEETRKIMEKSHVGKWNSDKIDAEKRTQYRDKTVEKAQNKIQNAAKRSGEKEESQADRLVKLCLDEDIELFNDQHNTPYVRITVLDAITQFTTSPQLYKDDSPTLFNTHKSGGEESEGREPCKVSETSSIASLHQNPVPQLKTSTGFHKEIMRLRDINFKTYLSHLMYEHEGKVVGSEALSSALNVLHYKACCGKKYTLYNRVAPDPSGDNSIWVDMADRIHRAYHITKNGWTIEVDPPILFRHYEHQLPLAEAVKGGDPWKLLEYVNVCEPDKATGTPSISSIASNNNQKRLLLMAQCGSYLLPEIPHPVNTMFGCKGTWKSSSQTSIRQIFDPSSVPLLSFPKDEHTLIQQIEHHWIPIFDNLSNMPRWFSDAVCRSVTGAGQETRELYTDDGVVIRQFKRCVMLNGLNIPAQRGDLLDRTILHETVLKRDRRTEAELKAAYEKDRPEILGGFLDAAVIALGKYSTVQPSKLFRLADFTRWGCALAEALGYTSDDFIAAYEDNVKSQNEETTHASNVATAFIAYCKTLNNPTASAPFADTPENVFHAVEYQAQVTGINVKQKGWPKAPQAFTRKLNEAKDAISSLGWNYEIIPKGVMREMNIWRVKSDEELAAESKKAQDAKPEEAAKKKQEAEAVSAKKAPEEKAESPTEVS